MAAIVKSLQAEHDLAELFDYIARESGIERAELVLRRIDRTLSNLAQWPRIRRVRSDLDGNPRTFSVWPWLVIYEPRPTDGGIFVWRIVDGRRDLPRVLRSPSDC